MAKQPRGIRNNNPLNIERRPGQLWKGQADIQSDARFVVFRSMVWGLRAAMVIIRRYIRSYKCCCVQAIVSRWAPSSENDTGSYVRFVSRRMGISPAAVIRWSEFGVIVSLVQAMGEYECGVVIDRDVIEDAYRLACM